MLPEARPPPASAEFGSGPLALLLAVLARVVPGLAEIGLVVFVFVAFVPVAFVTVAFAPVALGQFSALVAAHHHRIASVAQALPG